MCSRFSPYFPFHIKIHPPQICPPAKVSKILWVSWSFHRMVRKTFLPKISSEFIPPLQRTKHQKRNLHQVQGEHLPSFPVRKLELFQTWKCYQFTDNLLSTTKNRRLLVTAQAGDVINNCTWHLKIAKYYERSCSKVSKDACHLRMNIPSTSYPLIIRIKFLNMFK